MGVVAKSYEKKEEKKKKLQMGVLKEGVEFVVCAVLDHTQRGAKNGRVFCYLIFR